MTSKAMILAFVFGALIGVAKADEAPQAPVAQPVAEPAKVLIKKEMKLLTSVKFDGTTLSGTYMTGGGCRKHSGEVAVALSTEVIDGQKELVAQIQVLDVVQGSEDPCEAMISGSFEGDVKKALFEAVAAKGLGGMEAWSGVRVRMPEVAVRINDVSELLPRLMLGR
jgi:hypothetical protein